MRLRPLLPLALALAATLPAAAPAAAAEGWWPDDWPPEVLTCSETPVTVPMGSHAGELVTGGVPVRWLLADGWRLGENAVVAPDGSVEPLPSVARLYDCPADELVPGLVVVVVPEGVEAPAGEAVVTPPPVVPTPGPDAVVFEPQPCPAGAEVCALGAEGAVAAPDLLACTAVLDPAEIPASLLAERPAATPDPAPDPALVADCRALVARLMATPVPAATPAPDPDATVMPEPDVAPPLVGARPTAMRTGTAILVLIAICLLLVSFMLARISRLSREAEARRAAAADEAAGEPAAEPAANGDPGPG